jgi:hypothetical protein
MADVVNEIAFLWAPKEIEESQKRTDESGTMCKNPIKKAENAKARWIAPSGFFVNWYAGIFHSCNCLPPHIISNMEQRSEFTHLA